MTSFQARISCDVRWQLAAEAVDDRYIGAHVGQAKPKAGLYAKDVETLEKEEARCSSMNAKVHMSQLKTRWGLQLDADEEKHLCEEWGPLIR